MSVGQWFNACTVVGLVVMWPEAGLLFFIKPTAVLLAKVFGGFLQMLSVSLNAVRAFD